MEIPETGAIFSLGKSHLVENNQSYFFVKNDPVKRLVSGPNQSAVICESGRLFVWGDNQFGQLATGAGGSNGTDLVTKPTCVKSLKALGLKVLDISFGLGWSVILTNSNEIYFSGRNIFPEATKLFQKFLPLDVGTENFHLTRKAIALEEFQDVVKGEQFQRILAGNEHFAVLSSSGRLFTWGSNESNQLGQSDADILFPTEIKVDGAIKSFVCGPKSTLILTEKGQLFLTGTLNDLKFPQVMELNLNFPKEEIIFKQISHANEIYLVTESGNIYKSSESARNNNLTFNKFYDYDQDENGSVVKLLKGSSFFAALTKAKKLFTTFSESGHHLKTFREISKFKNLKILDFAIGDKHVLVLGVPKASRSLESSCRNLNSTYVVTPAKTLNLVNGLTGLNGNVGEQEDDEEHEGFRDLTKSKKIENLSESKIFEETLTTEFEDLNQNGIEMKGVDVAKLIQENGILMDPNQMEKLVNEKILEKKEELQNGLHTDDVIDVIENSSLETAGDILNGNDHSAEKTPNNSSPKTDETPPDILSTVLDSSKLTSLTPALKRSPRSRVGSGRSIKFHESTLQHNKSTERLNRPQTPYPDPNSSSPLVRKVSTVSSTEDDFDRTESPVLTDSLEHIPEDSPQTVDTVRRVSLKYSDRGLSNEKLNEITRIISAKTPGKRDARYVLIDDELEQDEEIKVEIDSTQGSTNEIRYINNGVDVTKNVKEIHEIESIDEIASIKSMEIQQLDRSPGRKISGNSGGRKTPGTMSEHKTLEKSVEEKTAGNSLKQKTVENKTPAKLSDQKASGKSTEQKSPEKIAQQITPGKSSKPNTSKVSTEQKSSAKVENLLGEAAILSLNDDKAIKNLKQTTQDDIMSLHGENEPNKTESHSKDDGKLKISRGEDDERTTASVNSNIITNNFDNDSDKDKYSLNDIETIDPETKKEKVRRFLKDLKNKGREMSCKNEESILVDDEPPKYTATAVEEPVDGKTSKVCTIL